MRYALMLLGLGLACSAMRPQVLSPAGGEFLDGEEVRRLIDVSPVDLEAEFLEDVKRRYLEERQLVPSALDDPKTRMGEPYWVPEPTWPDEYQPPEYKPNRSWQPPHDIDEEQPTDDDPYDEYTTNYELA